MVVTFCTGDAELCRRMAEEVRSLVPDRRHFVATAENWPQLRRELKRYRIGLAPVMLTREASALRRAAYRLAPHKILAYNSRLERHHLRFDLASLLFWRGVPLDRIYLRPWWWPWPKRERSVVPAGLSRASKAAPARRAAAASPCSRPTSRIPLAHGGAVRIYNLLREMAQRVRCRAVRLHRRPSVGTRARCSSSARAWCWSKSRAIASRAGARCCRPRCTSSARPPCSRRIAEERRAFGFETLQVEYTQLAEYGGDILVEHDVTFDLFAQIARRERTLSAAWDAFRWRRFETRALRQFPPRGGDVAEGRRSWSACRAVVIENGVDLERFRAAPEAPGQRLLFIGSFRHFPNIAAYRFFTEEVWPLLRDKFPDMSAHGGLRRRPSHLLARLHRFARARARPAHPPARLRQRRAPALRGEQPGAGADHGLRRHQREGAGSHGHAARRGLHHLGMRRTGPAARPQRLGRRYAPRPSPPASPP